LVMPQAMRARSNRAIEEHEGEAMPRLQRQKSRSQRSAKFPKQVCRIFPAHDR
jgi:hypothetical protein